MQESPLARKMKLKPAVRAVLVNPPAGYAVELQPLPEGVQLGEKLQGKFDWLQLFVRTQAELEKQLPKVLRAMKPESILWLTFPKGASKIQTDLTRDKGWEPLQQADLKWLTLISVNDTWSAFAVRPYKPGEPNQNFR